MRSTTLRASFKMTLRTSGAYTIGASVRIVFAELIAFCAQVFCCDAVGLR